MPAIATMQNTVYVIGLLPEDLQQVQQDFLEYPFPDWQLEELPDRAEVPISLLAGQAILVVGCRERAPQYDEAMWLVKLLVCGSPWVAVAQNPEQPSRELCETAGAAAYLTYPYTPAQLRELIWSKAIPDVGKGAVLPLSCLRLVRFLAVVGADVLLKFTANLGRTGFLAIKNGKPIHAKILDGAEGEDGLQEILQWGKGHVLGQRLPNDLQPNLPDDPEKWGQMIGIARAHPQIQLPGGREVCNSVVRELPEVTRCALVELRSGQVVAKPDEEVLQQDETGEIITDATELIQALLIIAEDPQETVEEVIVLDKQEWFAATRFEGKPLALIVSGEGQAPVGFVRLAFETAAAELEQLSGMVVEEA